MPSAPIYYVTRFLPGYRIPVMEQLNARLDGRLVVFAGQPPGGSSFEGLSSGRARNFECVPLPNIWMAGEKLSAQPFRGALANRPHPAVILAEEAPRSITLPLLMRYGKNIGAGRVLWGHFSSNNRHLSIRHPFDRYRIRLAQHADACVCYAEGIRQILEPYVAREKLFVARNTVDLAPLIHQRHLLQAEEKNSVRSQLGLPVDQPVVCFLGRLIADKGTSTLLDVHTAISKQRRSVLLVIGDGPERSNMERRIEEDHIPNVIFTGAVTEDEALASWLFASDVLLNPGYLGLSVNHAFSMGLPVVAYRPPADRRYHSPEWEYVKDGENGLLRKWDDPDDLILGTMEALKSRDRLSTGAIRFAEEELTLDRMVDGLAEAILYAEEGR